MWSILLAVAGVSLFLLGVTAIIVGLLSVIKPITKLGVKSRLGGLRAAVGGVAMVFVGFVAFGLAAGGKTTTARDTIPPVASADDSPNSAASPVTLSTAPAPSTQRIPASQAQLIAAVDAARQRYARSETDFQKGATRPERASAICESVKSASAQSWVGKVSSLTTNSDGYGVVTVEIGPSVYVGTWNNALSDSGDNTLVRPSSPVFASLAELKKGSPVIFSGTFIRSRADCFKEQSMTLAGSIRSPEFVLRFKSIELAP